MAITEQPFCVIIPIEGNLRLVTKICYTEMKKRGRPPGEVWHECRPGGKFLLSWEMLHKIVLVSGNNETKWLEISEATCEEYLMHQAYFEKSNYTKKRKLQETNEETN